MHHENQSNPQLKTEILSFFITSKDVCLCICRGFTNSCMLVGKV